MIQIATRCAPPLQVQRPTRILRRAVGDGIEPVAVRIDVKVAATDNVLKANDAAHLVAGLRGPVEDRLGLCIGVKGLPLDDADGSEHAERIGFGKIGALAIHELLQLIERAAIAGRQHIGRNAGGVGIFHGFGGGLAVQRINLGLFHQRHGRRQILRILIERAQEDKDVEGP